VRDDGFRVEAGDLLGVSSENAALNLIGFDEDSTQRTLLRLRQIINGSSVFADLPTVSDVVDDFSHDTSPTRFSVAVQLLATETSTTAAATTAASSAAATAEPLEHSSLGTNDIYRVTQKNQTTKFYNKCSIKNVLLLFHDNFGKYGPILIVLLLLDSVINCGRRRNNTCHLTSNLLPHFLAKF